jgi:hypothetical protein
LLAGFSIESAIPPMPVVFAEFSSTGDFVTGLTVGPGVPEVSTGVLLGAGAGLFALLSRRRRPSCRVPSPTACFYESEASG